jgi:hypothetical protein
VDEIDPPLAVEVPFDTSKLDDVDAQSLSIHRWEPDGVPTGDIGQLWEKNPAAWADTRHGSAPLRRPRGLAQADPLAAPGGRWRPLPTRVDLERGMAVAATDRPGRLALLGRPLRDLVAPTTRIVLEGPQGAQGAFFETVTVTLSAEDPSGIARMRYRLGFEDDWQEYDGPFVLRHADIPADAPEGLDERFLRGAGRRLVVASAIDGAGNIEEPPASRPVVIDRRADPVYTPPPATATTVLTGTAQAVVTGTLAASASAEGAERDSAGAETPPAGTSTGDADQGATTSVTAPGSPAATEDGVSTLPGRATQVAARSGDSSAASRLAPGAATAAARGAIGLPTLVVAGPVSPTPPPPPTRMPRADATATADVEARERAVRQTATARARRAATATAVGAPRRSTSMVPDPVEPPPPPGGVRVMVPTATPTPPALLAPVLTAPADGAGPACGVPVTLDWDGVAALRGRGSHRWELERLVVSEDGVPRWQALDGGETVGALTSTTLLSPPCGARLRWRVRGKDSSGRLGEWSAWRLLSPLDAPPPAAPTQDATGGYPYP